MNIYIYICWLGYDVGKYHTDASRSSTSLLKEKKTMRPTHPVSGVEGDATTTGLGAREPKPTKSEGRRDGNYI